MPPRERAGATTERRECGARADGSAGGHPSCRCNLARGQGEAIDADVEVGALVGPFRIVRVHGKSPGEVALHEPLRTLLIVGDAVVGNPLGRLSLLSERVMDDPPRLRVSLRRLLKLEFDTVLVGDGVSIREDAHERLRDLVAGFRPD